jgi:hypothetical protein
METSLPSAGELTNFLKQVALLVALGAAIVKPMVDFFKVIMRDRCGREIAGNKTILVAYGCSVATFFVILLSFEKTMGWRSIPLGIFMGFPMLGGAILHNEGEKLSRKRKGPTDVSVWNEPVPHAETATAVNP